MKNTKIYIYGGTLLFIFILLFLLYPQTTNIAEDTIKQPHQEKKISSLEYTENPPPQPAEKPPPDLPPPDLPPPDLPPPAENPQPGKQPTENPPPDLPPDLPPAKDPQQPGKQPTIENPPPDLPPAPASININSKPIIKQSSLDNTLQIINSSKISLSKKANIAVFYSFSIYAWRPVEQERNFQFFVNQVIQRYYKWEKDVVHYYLILNGYEDGGVQIPYEQDNVFVVKRKNEGYDLCAWRSTLNDPNVPLSQYDYFFFMNSGLTGPFIPVYYDKPWYTPWIKAITSKIKLVGPYASCQNTPHIPSMMLVTDTIGLSLIIGRMGCVTASFSQNEMEISTIILQNGYKIQSMETGYLNVDFVKNPNCNNGHTPYEEYFGLPSQLFELMFVKLRKQYRVEREWKIVERYMYFAEHYRTNCKECWQNYMQMNDCPEELGCTPPPFLPEFADKGPENRL